MELMELAIWQYGICGICGIDIAFIPMNLPFTMTIGAATVARKINPDILYVYHFGTSDTVSLRNILTHSTKLFILQGRFVMANGIKIKVISRAISKISTNSGAREPINGIFEVNRANLFIHIDSVSTGS